MDSPDGLGVLAIVLGIRVYLSVVWGLDVCLLCCLLGFLFCYSVCMIWISLDWLFCFFWCFFLICCFVLI